MRNYTKEDRTIGLAYVVAIAFMMWVIWMILKYHPA